MASESPENPDTSTKKAPEYRIVHNEPAGQWEVRLVDRTQPDELGAVIGYLAYDYLDNAMLFTSTVVMKEYGGLGIAAELTRTALDEVRAAGEHKIVPICSYTKRFIEKNPEYRAVTVKGK